MILYKIIYKFLFSVLMSISFLCFLLRSELINKNIAFFIEWQLISVNPVSFVIRLIFDWISLVFLGTVFLVSGSICAFSAYYINQEKNFIRFIILLLSFVASMVILILSPNIISILLGWDGLGLTSYALVIYYQNASSARAGILTVLSNRIGDVCILISIALIIYKSNWSFIFWSSLRDKIILFFIIIAGITKRAQIPFSAWLPAAIAAPTPVSALVHSSTLVTAGVYLLIRFSTVLDSSPLLKILLVFSVGTLFISGWSANFESDIKKIIALSTLSQLGLMIITLAMGIKDLAFFHLIRHAIFKSSLFMCAGVIIHMSDSTQDSRKIRTLSLSSPFLIFVFSLCNISLLGFPFLSGFYSKDLLLECTFSSIFNNLMCALVVVSTGFTVSYSLRVIFLAINKLNTLKSCNSLIDSNYDVIKGLFLLSLIRILLGFIFSWSYSWSIIPALLSTASKYYIIIVFLTRATLFFYLSNTFKIAATKSKAKILTPALTKIWFLPFLRTKPLSLFCHKVRLWRSKRLDSGWSELLGPQGLYTFSINTSNLNQQAQIRPIVKRYLITFMLAFWIFLIIWGNSSYRALHWSCKGEIIFSQKLLNIMYVYK